MPWTNCCLWWRLFSAAAACLRAYLTVTFDAAADLVRLSTIARASSNDIASAASHSSFAVFIVFCTLLCVADDEAVMLPEALAAAVDECARHTKSPSLHTQLPSAGLDTLAVAAASRALCLASVLVMVTTRPLVLTETVTGMLL